MSGRMKAAAEPPTLLGGGAGMVAAGFLAAGIAFLAIGLLVPPRDALFWVAFALLPPLAGTIGSTVVIPWAEAPASGTAARTNAVASNFICSNSCRWNGRSAVRQP
jgi:hypothetical protein